MGFTQEIKHLIFGLDVAGSGNDNTVLVLLERVQEYGHDEFEGKNKIGKPYYNMRKCIIMPLGTPAPMQYDKVQWTYDKVKEIYAKKMPERKYPMKPVLIIDRTGMGQPHFDAYREAGLDVYGIHFTSEGNKVNKDGRAWTVPGVDMTSALAVLTENDRLHIPAKIKHREKIIHQLANYKWKRKESGTLTAENMRSGDHDDICAALQVAVWYGEKGLREPMDMKDAKAFRDTLMSVGSIKNRVNIGDPVPKVKSWHADIPWKREPGQESYLRTSPKYKPKEDT